MTDISLIIPTYRNPKYLDLCIRSAVENKKNPATEIFVVVDGYYEESSEVLESYSGKDDNLYIIPLRENVGMAMAINHAVYLSNNPVSFVINDDNVLPTEWDTRLKSVHCPKVIDNSVVTVNQIEPHDGIYGFHVMNYGEDPEAFNLNYKKFLEYERNLSKMGSTVSSKPGKIFPFLISKKNFLICGGFDMWYESPFFVDLDFFLKLELKSDMTFYRTADIYSYHFGSRATKSGPEGDRFRASEGKAYQQFKYKWGFTPDIVGNAKTNNTRLPTGQDKIRGVDL